jgi:6-phosphogluconate dehydrogenase
VAQLPQSGYLHCGPAGAGHFVKMVHHGIEYGMLQAYGEGFEILKAAKEYDLDLGAMSHLRNLGTIPSNQQNNNRNLATHQEIAHAST